MTVAHDPGVRQLRQVGRGEIRVEGVEMSILARFLSVHLRATVVDRTGLEGRYNFHLSWTPVLFRARLSLLMDCQRTLSFRLFRSSLG
jgi:uncharacterized protein (TIGR03435 family)